jgi:pimeloyl-ACP methyl ester carboxylesterase
VGDYEIHAVEYGTSGSPILLVHGLSGSSEWWYRNIPGLAAEHRVVVPDLIGFGRSRRPRIRLPTLDTVAGVMVEWMDALEIERPCLVGHSMGGQMAIHLAAGWPERVEHLVLVDAAGVPRALSAGKLLQFAAEVAPLWRWGDPRFLPVIARDALRAGPWTIAQAIAHILRDDVRPLLPRIEAPTLIVWGERDTLVPLSNSWEMRQGIPGSQLAVLRGAAHNPMVDRPADFNRLLLRFLDGETVGR